MAPHRPHAGPHTGPTPDPTPAPDQTPHRPQTRPHTGPTPAPDQTPHRPHTPRTRSHEDTRGHIRTPVHEDIKEDRETSLQRGPGERPPKSGPGPGERPPKSGPGPAVERRSAVAPPLALEPGQRLLEPGQRLLEPGQRPLEPGQCPLEPGQRPLEPLEPLELGQFPLEPLELGQFPLKPLEPGQRPLEPLEPGQRPLEPLEPGQRPLEPLEPLEPGQRPLEPRRRPLEPGWSLSFAGCGFRGLYYVGALSCLLERSPELVHRAARFSGASSGSLVAAALAVGVSISDLCSDLVAMAAESRRLPLSVFHPSFSLLRRARDSLLRKLPQDAHQRATGRLCVSLTRLRDGRNVMVDEYGSRHELVQVLLCSCFFPVYCGFIPPTYRGERYMDGALSNNQPLFELRNTVTFAPFSGESDVCPRDSGCSFVQVCFGNVSIDVNTGNVYRVWTSFMPQTPQVLMETCLSGYSDALRFLQSSGLDGGRSQSRSLENGLGAETLPPELRTVLAAASSSDSALRPAHFSEPPVGAKVLGLVLDLLLALVRMVLLPLGLLLRLLLRLRLSRRRPTSNPRQKKELRLDKKQNLT